jgi:UDP-glucose:(heptosyl)LPS alpha-1,3-glucosyltransferase
LGKNAGLPGLSRHAGVKLLVAGKGVPPARPPAGTIFAGPVTDLENAMAAADLFVFPPIYEPSSNVVIEALVAGLPVVTTAQNGAAEILRAGLTGTVLARPTEVDGMVRAVDDWAGKNARVSVEASVFSLERNVAETLAVLELAAQEKRV